MNPNGTHPTLCDSVRGGQYVQALCLQTKGQEAGNSLGFGAKVEGHQLAGTPLWVYLVFQKVRSDQAVAEGVVASHIPCLLVTPSEQGHPQLSAYMRQKHRHMVMSV